MLDDYLLCVRSISAWSAEKIKTDVVEPLMNPLMKEIRSDQIKSLQAQTEALQNQMKMMQSSLGKPREPY